MSMKRMICFTLAAALLLACTGCRTHGMPEPKAPFDGINDYLDWAYEEGYPSGALTDDGPEGLNQDRFFTRPGMPGYDSGRIVVGDSRCVQLGIYEQRAGAGEYAVFAAWGGHYVSAEPYLPTEDFYSAVEACFEKQIETRGECAIFFFATVNDYDPSGEYNGEYAAAAIACAEKLASMRYEFKGREYAPKMTVIGIAGASWDGYNDFIGEYNSLLYDAVRSSSALAEAGFTTVPLLTRQETGFINDGLHYDDKTLKILVEYIIQ